MRVRSLRLLPLVVLLVVVALVVPSFVLAQSAINPAPPVVHIQDGGTSGRMESIFIPPLTGAPFSMMLVTEWSRPLGNGGSFTLVNKRRIVRDGRGRIYQERWLLVPKGSKIESRMDVIQITDPKEHTWLNCGVDEKICEVRPYGLVPDMVYKLAMGTSGPLPDGQGFRQHDDLGLSNSNGVDTIGYRETTTLNPGVLGNDLPMVSTREFWYSAKLGINLISKVDDPSSGRQSFSATELTTSEPDPRYFVVPEGYKVVDRRKGEEKPN
ncbi:hypothetical protein [Tunturibacter empetritectus]|uniref:Uncharacterized protein n=1 Tax=Tunturiibacter empetritectus TaxID=3069691 RepID=A0A7W8III2_9BACT|nr:hypothetical protein [Edaphobacter lichenicola]MBB5317792.1 hypothetical protein [Edaphobacter lichenicola]